MKTFMKKQKKKRFYKKSIWPSIVLFVIFTGSCVGMVLTFMVSFQGYLVDSKISDIHVDAVSLGRLIDLHMKDKTIFEAASFVEVYLEDDKDICITDEQHRILQHFGKTVPDFEREEHISVFAPFRVMTPYHLMPDLDLQRTDRDSILTLSFQEILKRSLDAFFNSSYEDDRWMEKPLFHEYYWAEIPVSKQGYRLYYRDSLTILQKNVFFMNMAVLAELVLLGVPAVLLFLNVCSSIAMQKRMVNLLYQDPVTGGNNWSYFLEQSKKILCHFRNTKYTYAIVSLHMIRYQDYCACNGSREGEALLKKIDGFLQISMDSGETFARFAKADFGLLLRSSSKEQCEKRMKKMLVELTGIKKDKMMSFSAGIYLLHPAANRKEKKRRQINIDQLYHFACAARGTMRGKDGEYIKVFDQQILQEQLWKHKVEETMEAALLNGEFKLYLQPKYHPVTEKIVGAEALVRWISPEDGLIPPNRFIPVFEENGFITRLDDYMILAVAKLQSEWKLMGLKQVPVSVNISRVNFVKEDLAEHICHLVDSYGAGHEGIELELTESAFFGNKERLMQILKELKMCGFCIAMDDFGAGYSSLNSLKDLPIDVLKLDMDFFRGEDEKQRGEIVVKETIRLAKALHMKIVAEGIEKKEQVEFLAEQGCDMIQGYYFAKPMPVEEFNERVKRDC
ncbi:MAG: EAL domain-containing protein [Eubacterium sp.]|nr:EAL domain-containing protein [Eubacterium sp.]